MAPSYFSHQWCEFCCATVGIEKGLHAPQVGGRETARAWKGCLKVGGKLCHHGFAPAFGLLALGDQPSDIPIQTDQFLVHRTQRSVLGGLNARLHHGQQKIGRAHV